MPDARERDLAAGTGVRMGFCSEGHALANKPQEAVCPAAFAGRRRRERLRSGSSSTAWRGGKRRGCISKAFSLK